MISPESSEVLIGKKVNFSAEVYDTEGNVVHNADILWSVDGEIGDIAQNGLFTATAAGAGSVVATIGELSQQAAVSVPEPEDGDQGNNGNNGNNGNQENNGNNGNNGNDNTSEPAQKSARIRGDFNGDGRVSLGDLVAFGDAWGRSQDDENWNPQYDLNGDGKIGLGDLVHICNQWCYHKKLAKLLPSNSENTLSMAADYDSQSSQYYVIIDVSDIENINGIGLTLSYDNEALEFIDNSIAGIGNINIIKDDKAGNLEINSYLDSSNFDGTISVGFTSKSVADDITFEILNANVVIENEVSSISNLPKISINYVPQRFSLSQNYPNPFNPTTTIEYSLSENTHVELNIYNVSGQKVASLKDEIENAGKHSVRWDATGIPSGVYIYKLQAKGITQRRKMLLLK